MDLKTAKSLAGGAGRGIWRNAETLLRAMLGHDENANGLIFTGQFKIGTYAGTGGTVVVSSPGFVPGLVLAWNESDGDEAFLIAPGSSCMRIGNPAATAATTLFSSIANATAGVDSGTTKGFQVHATLSENGKTYRYIALRNRPTT